MNISFAIRVVLKVLDSVLVFYTHKRLFLDWKVHQIVANFFNLTHVK